MIAQLLPRFHLWRTATLDSLFAKTLVVGSPISPTVFGKSPIHCVKTATKLQIHQGKAKGRWIPVTISMVDRERVIFTKTIMIAVGTEILARFTQDA